MGHYGHNYGKQMFQIRSIFFPRELVLIFFPHKTISFEEEWWRLRDVVSVKKRPNQFCMCFGVVGQHRIFGLGV